MPFKRKPGLGHYSATRAEWMRAYRIARIAIGKGRKPDHRLDGVRWKAQLIVAYERDGQGDRLRFDAQAKLAMQRAIDELLQDS